MTVKLSHSAIEKYKTCSEMYRLYYKENIRTEFAGSPLFFGSAMDEAVGVFLTRKKKNLTKAELEFCERDPYEVFDEEFTNVKINGNDVHYPLYPKAMYSKADFDVRLLQEEDYIQMKLQFPDLYTNYEELVTDLRQDFRNGTEVSETAQLMFNLLHWLSLRRKGHLLIAAYEDQIMPQIEEVYEIQKFISLKNDDGDILRGLIDFTAKWKDEGLVIFDNKTASKRYTKDSVKNSQQLMIYCENEGHYKAGFIVMLKDIKFDKVKTCQECNHVFTSTHKACPNEINDKRCNSTQIDLVEIVRPQVQVLIGDLEHEIQDDLFDGLQDVTTSVKEEIFEQDRTACWQWGKPCSYFNLCRTGSMDNLVKVKSKRK